MDLDLDAHFPRYSEFDPAVAVWCVTPDSPRTIHRFFDTSPFSPSGRYLAATRLAADDRLPRPGDVAEIVLVDLHTGRSTVVAETRGADTQLGAQVQWGCCDEELFFNDVDTGHWRPFGVKLDPATGLRQEMAGTVYMVSPAGDTAVSPCLLRTARTQAGYGVIVPARRIPVNRGAPDDDGVYVTDTRTGTCRLIASIRRIVETAVEPAPRRRGRFYCAHVKYNPQGSRIMLALRFLPGGRARARHQLITMTADGEDIRLAIPAREWSDKGGHHPNWCPDGEHVMMNLHLHGRGTGLRLVRARYDGTGLEAMIDEIPGSGHPTLHPNGRAVLTDVYQNGRLAFGDGTVPLRWIDLAARRERQVLRICTRPPFVGRKRVLRVDPHPAWDRSYRYVAFNACPGGERRVYVADLAPLLGS